MKSGERPTGLPRALKYPGNARRVLGELGTGAVRIEEVEYAPGLCLARHEHDSPIFIYIIEGEHWSGHSLGGDACAPGTVRYIPAGDGHENYFPTGSRCLCVEPSREIVELARADGDGVPEPGELASAAGHGARLHTELRERGDVTELGVESLVVELLVAGTRWKAERRGPTPRWVLRIREMLREERSRHLTLAELGQCAGRHPVQVSRQFRHHFGCTISEYVRQVRIARAQILLSRGNSSVADIALASGFADQSHFTNAFRRLTGIPPNRYRVQNSKARAIY